MGKPGIRICNLSKCHILMRCLSKDNTRPRCGGTSWFNDTQDKSEALVTCPASLCSTLDR